MPQNKKGQITNTGRTWFKKGFIPWNKGIGVKYFCSCGKQICRLSKHCASCAALGNQRAKGTKYTPEQIEKYRLSKLGPKNPMWGKKYTAEELKKILHRRPMSSLELKMQSIIDNNKLPYKFVGNGEFFIENKNPDFININGEKIAIEVYVKKHKEMFRNVDIETWKKERLKIFQKYGWNLLFFESKDLKEQQVLQILKGGY